MLRYSVASAMFAALTLVLAGCRGDSSGQELSYQQQVAKAQKEPLPDVRAKKLIRIAYGQAEAKDTSGAEETLRLAAKACEEVEDPPVRVGAFCLLAEVHARIGNRSQARRAVVSALAATEKVEDLETKGRALARVGRAQGALEDPDAALKSLKTAEEISGQLKDPLGKTLVLNQVAASYQKIGRQAESDRLIAASLELAKSIEDDRQRCEAIAAVAAELSAMNKKEAEQTFDLALETARKIDSPQSRAYALADIAERLSAAGDHAQTHEVLNEADLAAHKIPQRDQQRLAVERVRSLMGKLPRPR